MYPMQKKLSEQIEFQLEKMSSRIEFSMLSCQAVRFLFKLQEGYCPTSELWTRSRTALRRFISAERAMSSPTTANSSSAPPPHSR